MSENELRLELKRIYKCASKLSGIYKLLYKDTERFTIGLLDTKPHEEGLKLCNLVDDLLSKTKIFE